MSTKYQKLINQDLESKGEVLLRGGSAQSIEHHVDYKNFKRGVTEEYEDSLPGDEVFASINVAFRNLNCKVETVDNKTKEKITKTILSNVSGVFYPGDMVAIMGPSGSGKTTLLDCIAGKKTLEYSGQVLVNGHPRDRFFPRVIGYVPQESDINPNLTVRECLSFCAVLKAQHNDQKKIAETVDWVLEALSLSDVGEQRVGGMMARGISGGQKRRVCIGRALVSKPGAMFMDEPTSGLSATDAMLVMRCIRNIARRHKIMVVAVIHQPRYDVFARFDNLLLLSGGKCCYNGPRKNALKFFAGISKEFECPNYISPADHFLDIVTDGSKNGDPSQITDYFDKNVRVKIEADVDSVKKGTNLKDTITYRPWSDHTAPFTRQIIELTRREFILNVRDPQKITAKAANALVMGLLIGAMYWEVDSTFVPAFGYISLAIISMSAMVSLPSFYADRLMFNLERMDQLYTTLPYFLVSTGVGLFVSALCNVIFASIVWGMTGLEWTHFGRFQLIGFIIFWATDGLITWIAGACRTMDQAMATFNMTIGIFLLFNGYSANTKTTPYWLNWLCFASPLYYSLEMFLDTLYAHSDKWVYTGERNGMRQDAFWQDFFICLALGAFGRIMGFLAMKYMHRVQR